jgi:type II secretory pathway pseudopilin PulG
MIVIALAALAYTWFSGIFASLTGTASTSITQTTQQMQAQFRIEAAACIDNTAPANGNCANGAPQPTLDQVQFTIRNTGNKRFDPTKTEAYIDGNRETFSSITYGGGAACAAGTFDNGCTAKYYKDAPLTTTPICGTTKSTLKITIETGLTDSTSIDCV